MNHEILESQTFPEIVFIPQAKGTVHQQGSSQVEVSGTFRLHGQDQDLTLPVSVQLASGQATASTQFTVSYQKWKLKHPSSFMLRAKDTVDIEIPTAGHIARTNRIRTKSASAPDWLACGSAKWYPKYIHGGETVSTETVAAPKACRAPPARNRVEQYNCQYAVATRCLIKPK